MKDKIKKACEWLFSDRVFIGFIAIYMIYIAIAIYGNDSRLIKLEVQAERSIQQIAEMKANLKAFSEIPAAGEYKERWTDEQ